MPICAFLVYKGFDVDLYAITIYRHIKTLPDLSEPAFQALLTFLCGWMTSRLVNDTRTFILSSVCMDSTPPASCTLDINKFNITFTTLCSSHQEPGSDLAPPAASSDIKSNLFQHFLSTIKLPGLPPSPAITSGSTEPTTEDIHSMWREEIDLHTKLCRMNVRDEASLQPYLLRLKGKYVSESNRYQIITGQVRNTGYYDGHSVPLPDNLLKTIKKRKYISK